MHCLPHYLHLHFPYLNFSILILTFIYLIFILSFLLSASVSISISYSIDFMFVEFMGWLQGLGRVTLALRIVFMFGNCLGLGSASFSFHSEWCRINFVAISPFNPISY